MSTTHILSAAFAAALVGGASAGVTAVDEFAGEIYETFEGVATPGGYPGPLEIFGGAVTLNDSLANLVVIAFNWQGPAGEVLPYGGNLMGGLPAGSALFEFNTPVYRFGGYITTVGLNGGGTAVFRDADGSVIDTLTFGGNPTEWAWVGWESDTAISHIELTGNNGPGFGFQLDNLTLNTVPAPGAIVVLASGACLAGRRRRG